MTIAQNRRRTKSFRQLYDNNEYGGGGGGGNSYFYQGGGGGEVKKLEMCSQPSLLFGLVLLSKTTLIKIFLNYPLLIPKCANPPLIHLLPPHEDLPQEKSNGCQKSRSVECKCCVCVKKGCIRKAQDETEDIAEASQVSMILMDRGSSPTLSRTGLSSASEGRCSATYFLQEGHATTKIDASIPKDTNCVSPA